MVYLLTLICAYLYSGESVGVIEELTVSFADVSAIVGNTNAVTMIVNQNGAPNFLSTLAEVTFEFSQDDSSQTITVPVQNGVAVYQFSTTVASLVYVRATSDQGLSEYSTLLYFHLHFDWNQH